MIKRLVLAGAMEMENELLNGNNDGKLYGDKLLMAKRMAAARQGCAIRMDRVIELIIALENPERLNSPIAWILAPPTLQRAGPSGLKAHLPPLRCRVDSFDEEELERPVFPPFCLHLEFNDGKYEQAEQFEP